jgi:hypothetical protein
MTEATAEARANARGADTSKLYASRLDPAANQDLRCFSFESCLASIHACTRNISLSYLTIFLFISLFLSPSNPPRLLFVFTAIICVLFCLINLDSQRNFLEDAASFPNLSRRSVFRLDLAPERFSLCQGGHSGGSAASHVRRQAARGSSHAGRLSHSEGNEGGRRVSSAR